MVFTIPQFYFSFYSAFSGISFFEDFYIALYNFIFTGLPVIIRAIFEQDIYYIAKSDKGKNVKYIRDEYKEKPFLKKIFPTLYHVGQKNTIFTSRNFFIWLFEGFMHGLIILIWVIYCLHFNINNTSGRTPDFWLVSITA